MTVVFIQHFSIWLNFDHFNNVIIFNKVNQCNNLFSSLVLFLVIYIAHY